MRTPTEKDPPFTIYSLSEYAVTVEFGNEISDDIFQQVSAFNQCINENPFPGFRSTLPAYATITIFFDPVQVFSASQLKGEGCFEKITNYIIGLDELCDLNKQIPQPGNTVTIPVCYGGAYGPDIDLVAAHHQITIDEVIRLHSSAIYKVYMLGFVPGFAYLGGLDPQLAMPRKPVPRKAVPAGSVALAGMQTGVYPMQTPGGWQIIGRTPVKMFDLHAKDPTLLKAGDQVVFKPISEEEFKEIAGGADAN